MRAAILTKITQLCGGWLIYEYFVKQYRALIQARDDRVVDGKRPKPMPSRDPRRMTRAWPFFTDPNVEVLSSPGEEPSLTDAVASIVGIAAERARSSGTLDALRAAVEAALQAAAHQVEASVAPATPSSHASSGPR